MRRSVWAVVVAGGSGARYGGQKQFDLLGGRPLVTWAVAASRHVADGVVAVVPPDRAGERPGERAGERATFGADIVVTGGTSRSGSVRRGLAAVPDTAELVVVHDAARPLASAALFEAVLAALETPGVDGAVCAVPVADTVKSVRADGTVAGTVDRSTLVAVQTPQAFRASVLRSAHAGEGEATDDAALLEALGSVVRVVSGDVRNVKVTTPADLAYCEHVLVQRP